MIFATITRPRRQTLLFFIAFMGFLLFTAPQAVMAQSADETAVMNCFAGAIQAYNAKNLALFMTYVAPDYMNHGQNYSQFMADISESFSDPNFQPFSYQVNNVSVVGADATMLVTWTGGNDGTETIHFKKENGTWFMYGDQERYDVTANSLHVQFNTDGTPSGHYYGAFGVEDPLHTMISVTMTGTNITEPCVFVYHPEALDWRLSGNCPTDYGTSPPSNITYNILVTDASGQHTYTRMIDGGVVDFATNLAPTGSIAGNIIFTFTGIPNGEKYFVELNDANWNRIWDSSHDSTSTTVPYTGPALQAGTYHYSVLSKIGVNNSITHRQFTYTPSDATISFSGSGVIDYANGSAISGATIEMVGNASISTTQNADGSYTLSGLPSGQDFEIKVYKPGTSYIPNYGTIWNSTSNITISRIPLCTATYKTTNFGVQSADKGVITALVRDKNAMPANNWGISGATVNATDGSGNALTVKYNYGSTFDTTSTYVNGNYYINNLNDGTVVTVSATKAGVDFPQGTSYRARIHADGINGAPFNGVAASGTMWVTATMFNSSGTPIQGATVAKVTNNTTGDTTGGPSITTKADGSFTLTGLPTSSLFYRKITQTGYFPSYVFFNNVPGNAYQNPGWGLWTQTDMTNAGVSSGYGMVRGRVYDNTNATMSGAIVTCTSSLGNTYQVKYQDASGNLVSGPSTFSNGVYVIPNVAEGDTVTAYASKSNWYFAPQTVTTHGDSLVFMRLGGMLSSPLFAFFTGDGLYSYSSSTWTQLTKDQPTSMILSGSSLYAYFSPWGLYQWNGSTWSLLTKDQPSTVLATSSTLYADFASWGLYSWNGSTWTGMTTSHPAQMVASGSTLYAYFTGDGLYSWNGSWTRLTTVQPQSMTTSGSTLYAYFTGDGLYSWNGSWSRLTKDQPATMRASGSYLYADFASWGLYSWNGSTWTGMTTSHPAQIAASGSTLFVDFAGDGLYAWNGSTWSLLTKDHPTTMLASGSTLCADFASYGLYTWNGSTWTKLTGSHPATMVVDSGN